MNFQVIQALAISVCLLLPFAWTQSSTAQGKLSRIRDSVRENETEQSHDSPEEKDNEDEHSYYRSSRDHHDDYDRDHDVSLVSIGVELFELAMMEKEPVPFPGWCARFTGFGGTDFDDIGQGGLAALIQPPGLLGIDTSITLFRETGVSYQDYMWLGDLNLVNEVIHSERIRVRAGVGINWLSDSFGGDVGINLTTGLDLKLSHRLTLAAEVDFGTLGDTDLFHTQVSIGRQMERAELVLGFDNYDIGGTTISSPFVGLRFRF